MNLPPHTPSATDQTSEVALAAEMVLGSRAATNTAETSLGRSVRVETVPGSQAAAAALIVETTLACSTAAALIDEMVLACRTAAVLVAAVTPEGATAMMAGIARKVIPRRVVSARKKSTLPRSPLPELPDASGSSLRLLDRRTH